MSCPTVKQYVQIICICLLEFDHFSLDEWCQLVWNPFGFWFSHFTVINCPRFMPQADLIIISLVPSLKIIVWFKQYNMNGRAQPLQPVADDLVDWYFPILSSVWCVCFLLFKNQTIYLLQSNSSQPKDIYFHTYYLQLVCLGTAELLGTIRCHWQKNIIMANSEKLGMGS